MCRPKRLLLMIGLVVAGVMMLRHHRQQSFARVTAETIDAPDAAVALRTMTHSPTPDKSWVAGPDQTDGDTRYVVGRTRKPALSESEALHEAREDVESRVLSLVTDAMRPAGGDAKYLAQRISSDVSAGRFEIDRVAEKFDRPYSQLWTETVLLDLSRDKLNAAIAGYQSELHSRRRHIRTRWDGLGALMLLVLGGYVLSNVITRGYCTGRLRIIAMLVIGLGAIVLI